MTTEQKLREALQAAIWRLEDVIEAEDGQAVKEAKKALPFLRSTLSLPTQAEPVESGEVVIDGNTSDGYHTFNELYEFRKAYNAALFNEWASSGKCNVHKSWRHHDGELCFGGGWFIVVAVLPDGQISNHYEAKDWDLFAVPESERALFEFDGHTGPDVISRLKAYTPPASQEQAEPAAQEPFGYFRAEPFGWTDCAKTDEGAIPLYDRPTEVDHLKNELRQSDDMLKAVADLCQKYERWLGFLHKPNKDAEGFEWGIARVKFEDGKTIALWTNQDHSDLDVEIERQKANAPEGALVGPVGAGVDFALKGVPKTTQSNADSTCADEFALDPKSSIWICNKCGAVERKRYTTPQPAPASAELPELASAVVNDACWEFAKAMPHQLPGPIWNDLKPAIYAALMHYHRAALSAQAVPDERDKVRDALMEDLSMAQATLSASMGYPTLKGNGGQLPAAQIMRLAADWFNRRASSAPHSEEGAA